MEAYVDAFLAGGYSEGDHTSIANRAYNARGGLSELKLDSSVIDTRSYDDGGRMTSEVLGNGITETRSYRNDNLLSGISYSNTNIGNLRYSWDANKNKTAETIGGVMSGYGVSIPNFVLGFRFTANRTISFETPIISKTGTLCNCPAK